MSNEDLEQRINATQEQLLRVAQGVQRTLERIITLAEIVEKQGDRIKALEAALNRLVPNIAND